MKLYSQWTRRHVHASGSIKTRQNDYLYSPKLSSRDVEFIGEMVTRTRM